MTPDTPINEYIRSLLASARFGPQVAFHTVLPAVGARWAAPEKKWPQVIVRLLEALGIQGLYQHQAAAVDAVRNGKNVVVATPTASGKTLIYNLPVLEKIHENPNSRALYLFPLKALAQDQLQTFNAMAGQCPSIAATAAIYDGDTTAWRRSRIRHAPPNVLMSNPEMLHLSILAHHEKWAAFLSGVQTVVVDEVHTYRGVTGSHMAQIFRRFHRICALYGASPCYVFCSATVANPGELTRQLTGLDVVAVEENGAARGKRHVVFIDGLEGPARTAVLLLKAALARGLRTIVYTQSRKMAELISIWAQRDSGALADRISPYRSGYLAEERRRIEQKLSSGHLLAVISTSALELGIDIGDLDLCLLVGYPGTVVSTWQRGGRVGRSGQDSALALIAGEDALDQYFLRNPWDLIRRSPEAAVINPGNPIILRQHLVCAAAERPLRQGEPMMADTGVIREVRHLEDCAQLLRSADGQFLYSTRKNPQRDVDLRGTGARFEIISQSGERIGEIDGFRAFRETHPGAIYLHKTDAFRVDHLDIENQCARVSRIEADYYTRVTAVKQTEILEILDARNAWGTQVYLGRLRVTDQVTGFERWKIRPQKKLEVVPLDLPPLIFETEGLWFRIPHQVQARAEAACLHFMGGIHAVEHAAIGIFPLLVMADRNDLGGISTPWHSQVQSAAIFIYDGIPGGAGLSRQACRKAEALLGLTLKSIQTCSCDAGCPSCVHSPKCGSGNRPIDKKAAIFILKALKEFSHPDGASAPAILTRPPVVEKPYEPLPLPGRYGVLDIETRRSAQEVGGWHRADLMGVSCAVLYDSVLDEYITFFEDRISDLIRHLKTLELVVGFNIIRFDYAVLRGYEPADFASLPTLDMLAEVKKRLGYRLSLDQLARTTLGAEKSADGLAALRWWKQGEVDRIVEYCRMDVKITRDLFLFGKKNGYLLFANKAGNVVRIPARW